MQADTSRITEIYRRNGRYDVKVEPKIIDQPNNRVDLVFEVTEGAKTGVKSIEFLGNKAFSAYRLRDVIKTRETNFLSFSVPTTPTIRTALKPTAIFFAGSISRTVMPTSRSSRR